MAGREVIFSNVPRMDVATPPSRRRQRPANSFVRRLAARLAAVRGDLEVKSGARQSLAEALRGDVSPAQAADSLAQAIVCGLAVAASLAADWDKCRAWLWDQTAAWERFVLERIAAADGFVSNASFSDLTHLYEHLLEHDQPGRRKRAGVFYTPQPIVRYMLRQIDVQLREEFGLPLGLADPMTWGEVRDREPSLILPPGASDIEPFVRLFDPAVGTGTYLLEAIDFIHDRLADTWRASGLGDEDIADRWNDYVPRHLLPRLWGMELLPAPCFLARLHMALKLARTGYRFEAPGRIEIHLGNTLAGPSPSRLNGPFTTTRSVSKGRSEPAHDVPFTVILGNPPFSYLSENQSDWIESLVRGDNGQAGYLRADGQKLGERKTWLHDDYVKFLRYAQWRIETTGCGIVAFVTNHGYLNNATFRMMRQQLLRTFPRVSVVDLHGNRKAREVAPDGEPDENAFGLDQGTAIGFFRRPPNQVPPQVEHAELWGTREAKFWKLDCGQLCSGLYVPAAPNFLLGPAAADVPPEYAAAWSLTELMPIHATAPVTARDRFVVAFTREDLCERLQSFRDLSISDEEIRRRYFTRTRSPRYAAGDTRGWKLADARRTLAALDDWESFIQPCQYRPFDWRWIFWHPAMIDWPRSEVTRHLAAGTTLAAEQEGESGRVGERAKEASPTSLPLSSSPPLPFVSSPSLPLGLIARRQLPPSEPATYFWATSALTLDGIIRNDNRGSESLFVFDSAEDSERMAHYAYALFHSPTYRLRYAGALRTDFPRVLQARDESLTIALAEFGRQLIALHTQRPRALTHSMPAVGPGGPAPAEAGWLHPMGKSQTTGRSRQLCLTVAPRFPQHHSGRIWIDDERSIGTADEATWQFRVGAHQVARKWLADRRGRPLGEADVAWYAVILDTIVQTRALTGAIDETIEQHGGFPNAFHSAKGGHVPECGRSEERGT